MITQVRDIVESCILVSGVERTFLYRLILESLKNKWQIFSENSYNSIRVNFSWILLWFLFCWSTYFFFLILPFVCKMATDFRKSSISWPKWPSIKIKNILFDSSWDDVSTHMCFKIIRIYLPLHFLATKIKSAKKYFFCTFICRSMYFFFLILPLSLIFRNNSIWEANK